MPSTRPWQPGWDRTSARWACSGFDLHAEERGRKPRTPLRPCYDSLHHSCSLHSRRGVLVWIATDGTLSHENTHTALCCMLCCRMNSSSNHASPLPYRVGKTMPAGGMPLRPLQLCSTARWVPGQHPGGINRRCRCMGSSEVGLRWLACKFESV